MLDITVADYKSLNYRDQMYVPRIICGNGQATLISRPYSIQEILDAYVSIGYKSRWPTAGPPFPVNTTIT